MLQRVDQGLGSGSVSEWGPASSGVVRSAPVHTTAGIPALVILQYCHPKSCMQCSVKHNFLPCHDITAFSDPAHAREIITKSQKIVEKIIDPSCGRVDRLEYTKPVRRFRLI